MQYILQGLANGFHIGMDPGHRCISSHDNMHSAKINSQPVDDYLATELAAGRIVGPFEPHDLPTAQVSRFGVIPKANQPGKWRLILDLSSPRGHSVNDGIPPELCSLTYASVDQAVEKIVGLGRDALLAKVDVEHAYRNIPVHPDDRILLAMRWGEKIYIDTVLPFGLRSAPKIFSAVADAVEWIALEQGVSLLMHYLDDFLTMGRANAQECATNLETIKSICAFLGLPLKVEKVEGPLPVLVFLGIILDTIKQELRLPPEKVKELRRLITEWKAKSSCTKRELLRLIGKLAHATKVVVSGRTFLRRMIDTSSSVRQLDHHVKLRTEFHSDLAWWDCFLPVWNARSIMQVHGIVWIPQITFTSDASGSWGCGAIWDSRWIQYPWHAIWLQKSIALKELLPIILACALWGPLWSHKQVQVQCDNAAVVDILRTKTSKCTEIMHLLRCLHFFTAQHDIVLRATHLPGIQNVAADAISRNHLQVLNQVAPEAQSQPDRIPNNLLELVVFKQPDWTSVNWRRLLSDFAKQV